MLDRQNVERRGDPQMRASEPFSQGHRFSALPISRGLKDWLYNRESRLSVLPALARMNTPASLALLQRAATDPLREVRRDAYSVLAWQVRFGRLEPELERIAILDLLDPLPKLCDRREIARALRWAPDNKPVAALIEVLRLLDATDDPCARDTRIALALALGQLGDQSAIAPLLSRLKIETDPGTQLTLASALADLGNEEGERKVRQRLEAMSENSLWNLSNGGESMTTRRIAAELYSRSKRQQ